jgi:hypothetical protein
MLFAAARALGATRLAALGVALAYGLGTSAWSIASQALWQHGPAQFWLALAMLLLARNASAFGVGGALGMMVLCRPPDFFLALAVGAWAMRAWRRDRGRVLGFLAGAAIPAIVLGTLNALWFGAPWRVAQSIRVIGSDASELPGGRTGATTPSLASRACSSALRAGSSSTARCCSSRSRRAAGRRRSVRPGCCRWALAPRC